MNILNVIFVSFTTTFQQVTAVYVADLSKYIIN